MASKPASAHLISNAMRVRSKSSSVHRELCRQHHPRCALYATVSARADRTQSRHRSGLRRRPPLCWPRWRCCNICLTARLQSETAERHERSAKWWGAIASHGQLAGALGLISGGARSWEASNRAHIAAVYSLGKRASIVKAMARLIRTGAQIALYGCGAWLVVKNELAPGALVASAILLGRALGPLEGLVGSVKSSSPSSDLIAGSKPAGGCRCSRRVGQWTATAVDE